VVLRSCFDDKQLVSDDIPLSSDDKRRASDDILLSSDDIRHPTAIDTLKICSILNVEQQIHTNHKGAPY
jgi:hypothetical protein